MIKTLVLNMVIFFAAGSEQFHYSDYEETQAGSIDIVCSDECNYYYSYTDLDDCKTKCLNYYENNYKKFTNNEIKKSFYEIVTNIAKNKGIDIGRNNVTYKFIPLRVESGEEIEAMATEFTKGQLTALLYDTKIWPKDDCFNDSEENKSKNELLRSEEINKPARNINKTIIDTITEILSKSDPVYNYRLPYENENKHMAHATDPDKECFDREWFNFAKLRNTGTEGTQNINGFYDTLGNIRELVEFNPGSDHSQGKILVCGGSYRFSPIDKQECYIYNVMDRHSQHGFRLVRTKKQP
ncbi:MAG: hypothetical protein JXA66_01440 [Oligoflexia bacterium]|nr:hypothetical protein [Oligoflexia bacterium]